MKRRKAFLAAAAIFTIGVAFAARTPSVHAGRHGGGVQQRDPWVPGTNMLMSAHADSVPLAPPR